MTDLTRDYPVPAVRPPAWWDTGHPDDREPYVPGRDGLERSEEVDRQEADTRPAGFDLTLRDSARRWKEQAARVAEARAELVPCCRDGYRTCGHLPATTTWLIPSEVMPDGQGRLAEVASSARVLVMPGGGLLILGAL